MRETGEVLLEAVVEVWQIMVGHFGVDIKGWHQLNAQGPAEFIQFQQPTAEQTRMNSSMILQCDID